MHARKDLIIIHDGRKMCQIQFLRITRNGYMFIFTLTFDNEDDKNN